MKLGRVRGTVVASIKDPGMVGMKLLIVQPLDERRRDAGACVVAADGVYHNPQILCTVAIVIYRFWIHSRFYFCNGFQN